jgi:hypothetical protein
MRTTPLKKSSSILAGGQDLRREARMQPGYNQGRIKIHKKRMHAK